MAVRCELIIYKPENDSFYLAINKRGKGTTDFQGCWNIPCGYLEWETLPATCTRELVEECQIYIPKNKWKLQNIEDDPEASNNGNVTISYRCFITYDVYKEACKRGKKIAKDNKGEENEVEEVELMPLSLEEIDKHKWAFNHKDVAILLYNLIEGVRSTSKNVIKFEDQLQNNDPKEFFKENK